MEIKPATRGLMVVTVKLMPGSAIRQLEPSCRTNGYHCLSASNRPELSESDYLKRFYYYLLAHPHEIIRPAPNCSHMQGRPLINKDSAWVYRVCRYSCRSNDTLGLIFMSMTK